MATVFAASATPYAAAASTSDQRRGSATAAPPGPATELSLRIAQRMASLKNNPELLDSLSKEEKQEVLRQAQAAAKKADDDFKNAVEAEKRTSAALKKADRQLQHRVSAQEQAAALEIFETIYGKGYAALCAEANAIDRRNAALLRGRLSRFDAKNSLADVAGKK